jgi:tRNA-dihydrouridine synthase A
VVAPASAAPLPVTVKHRIGIDERDSFPELLAFVDTVSRAGARRFSVHARKAWLQGLDPRQNRTIPPLRHDWVHRLKAERPGLTIEINGGLQHLEDCLHHLGHVDGAMVGRAVYDHPLRWAEVDLRIHGDGGSAPATAASVVRGLIPHAERWRTRGGRLWPIARHLVKLVQGVHGARGWRHQLTQAAGEPQAGAEVLERAALVLEQAQS